MLKNSICQIGDKKILILGFGKEGIDNYLALRKLFPEKVFGIGDKKELKSFDLKTQKIFSNDKNLKLYLGESYLNSIGEHDLIIKTPGIPEKVYKKYLNPKIIVSSQTEIFFDYFPGLIVGVTGTKGKGTTSSLIYAILKKAGLSVYLGGNIGKPVFQYLLKSKPNDIFVYELSSHQLQNLKKSPQIAVFLNLFQDHLDYYKNQLDYEKAKANIAKNQTTNDYLIFNSSDEKIKQIAQKSKAIKIPFSLKTQLTPFERSLKKCYLLRGDFNFLNLKAALKVSEILKIKPEIIKKAVKDFKGLPHRLEYVGKFKGIEFYNNSMATIPQTTILDLKTFKDNPISLIIGGSDKGNDYKELAKAIKKGSVKNLIILGQGTGQKILESIHNLNFQGTECLEKCLENKEPSALQIFQAQTMKEAVKICFEKTPKNGICLLSPASASFNLFKDYQDRGEQFVKAVKILSKNYSQ